MATKKPRPVRTLVTLVVCTLIAALALIVGHVAKGAPLTPQLALDLQGGTQLILTPIATDESGQRMEVTDQDLQEAIGIIRNRVDASGVSEAEITSMGSSNIVVSLPGHPSEETLDLIRSSSQMDFRPVLQMGAATTTADTSSSEQVQSGADEAQSTTDQAAATQSGEQAQSGDDAQSAAPVTTAVSEEVATLYADADQDGTISEEPATSPANNSDDAWVTEAVTRDFLMLDCTDPSALATGTMPDADKPMAACDQDGQVKYILGPVDVAGSHLETATAGIETNQQGSSTGRWQVSLAFDAEGTKQFAESSQRLYDFQSTDEVKNRFAAVLDGVVITAPSMNVPITDGKASITGSFGPTEAKSLANKLSFGSLPLNFEVQSEQQISATLGSDHLEKGIWAGLIGLLLVVLYMVWQYRGLALLSAGSLLVAGLLTYLVITILSWTMGYRLSLPGVAGLIVAVGITADSFIVYFERIRDEVRDGHPLTTAVQQGWDRAKRTIIISDAVNLVAAIVLYMLAVGGVQGFAFTLGVTTIVDLIVVVFFTHPMMLLLTRIPFFANGHKWSGFDPEHLGAKSSLIYAGRGRVTTPAERGVSLAEKRFAEAHARVPEDTTPPDPDSSDQTSSDADTLGEDR